MAGGRPKGAWTPQKVRERIQTTKLVDRLTDHVLGKVEMAQTQVTAALGLLRKSLPDLQAIEHSGDITNRPVTELSDAELIAIAASELKRTPAKTSRTKEPEELH